MEYLGVKNVSYLFARDPSILAWNRGVLKRVNLEKELLKDNTQVSLQNETVIIIFLKFLFNSYIDLVHPTSIFIKILNYLNLDLKTTLPSQFQSRFTFKLEES